MANNQFLDLFSFFILFYFAASHHPRTTFFPQLSLQKAFIQEYIEIPILAPAVASLLKVVDEGLDLFDQLFVPHSINRGLPQDVIFIFESTITLLYRTDYAAVEARRQLGVDMAEGPGQAVVLNAKIMYLRAKLKESAEFL